MDNIVPLFKGIPLPVNPDDAYVSFKESTLAELRQLTQDVEDDIVEGVAIAVRLHDGPNKNLLWYHGVDKAQLHFAVCHLGTMMLTGQ